MINNNEYIKEITDSGITRINSITMEVVRLLEKNEVSRLEVALILSNIENCRMLSRDALKKENHWLYSLKYIEKYEKYMKELKEQEIMQKICSSREGRF